MIFLDADVRLEPDALKIANERFINKNIDFLSVFPSQQIKSIGEWLIVPLMDWILYSFLPLKESIYFRTQIIICSKWTIYDVQ